MENPEILMGRVQEGDRDAFEALVRAFAPRLYAFLYRMGAARTEADDLLQEIFLAVYRGRGRFDPTRRFNPWIYGIALLTWKQHLRREARQARLPQEGWGLPGVADDRTGWDEGPEGWLERDLLAEMVRSEIGDMPEEQRAVLVLRHYEGLTYAEIAEALDIPLGTVESRLYYGLRLLRERLSRRGILEGR